MTELPVQVSRLPVQPSPATKLVSPSADATGSTGFKLSLSTPRKLPYRCCLVFRNFYVAWMRIVQVNVDGSSTELAAAYPLMQHLHCEDDAQNWQVVKLDELPVSWNPHEFDSLCVYLSQPSPLWETWELRDFKLYVAPQEQETGEGDAKSVGPVSPRRLEKRLSTGTGRATEDRLTQLLERRTSRSALAQTSSAGVELNAVEEQAARCLDLVRRLRELLHN